MPKSFVFLGDLIDLEGKKSIKLADGYILTKANKSQVVAIKNNIEPFIVSTNLRINKYERKIKQKNKNEAIFYPLDENEWNYWIIQSSTFQFDKKFGLALQLSKLDFTIILEGIYPLFPKKQIGIMSRYLTTANYFIDDIDYNSKFHYKKVTSENVKELRKIFMLLNDLDEIKYDFIVKALDDFVDLGNISKSSTFKVIGYFSILEHLLTTYKSDLPNSDSLKIQLSKKIMFLNTKFEKEIQLSDFFKGPHSNTIETIVRKLYEYRNDIAHGNKSDFENDLQLLKNQRNNILEFLKLVLKNVLCYAIEYPQLVSDLKEC